MKRIPSYLVHLFYATLIFFFVCMGWKERSDVFELQRFSPLFSQLPLIFQQKSDGYVKYIKSDILHSYHEEEYTTALLQIKSRDSLLFATLFDDKKNFTAEIAEQTRDSVFSWWKVDRLDFTNEENLKVFLKRPVQSPVSDDESLKFAQVQCMLVQSLLNLKESKRFGDYGDYWGWPCNLFKISPDKPSLNQGKVEFAAVVGPDPNWNTYNIRAGGFSGKWLYESFKFDTVFSAPGQYFIPIVLESRIEDGRRPIQVYDTLRLNVLPSSNQ